VDSALHQSYSNVEVIIVDDGSTDETVEVLKAYGDKIKTIVQENKGAAAARNRGIQEASGEYLTFLDADDSYQCENVEKKLLFLNENPQYQWCYSDWAWVDDAGLVQMYGHEPKVSLAHLKASGDVLDLALRGYRLGTNVFMFKRALVDKLQGFDESLKVLEDYDFYLRAAALSPLGFVDEVLCHIYQHTGSLGTDCDKAVAYQNRLRLHKKMNRLFAENLKEEVVAKDWRLQQADLYRNLSALALVKNHYQRASIFLCASLKYKKWQLGILKLWFKIVWQRMRLNANT